ncbi:glycoside hydrolase family 15 protein [Haloarcula sp. JP-L23]|uniref:glycoside hydrolase family 15 protein n=1 Tax=Haloarcula sp. JP-L23 TaxID=2716717 RepID=UPI00140EBC66|nr:twin-arginine translocation signal domain-containing protein [Haloarcula sp. JP-L23]
MTWDNGLERRTFLKGIGASAAAGGLLASVSTPALAGENYADSDKDALTGTPNGAGDAVATVNQYPNYNHGNWFGTVIEEVNALDFHVEMLRDLHVMIYDDDWGITKDVRNDAAGSEVSVQSSTVPTVNIHNWFEFSSGSSSYYSDLYQDVIVSANRPALHVRNELQHNEANGHTAFTLVNPDIDDGDSAGSGDSGEVVSANGYEFFVASDGNYYLAAAQHRPSTGKSSWDGHRVGSTSDKTAWDDIYTDNDGWIDENSSNSGNIDCGGGLWHSTDTNVVWETVVGFGTSKSEAIQNATDSLNAGWSAEHSDFETAWQDWHDTVHSAPTGDATADAMYEQSLTAMKASEDSSGASVAGLFEPHGDQYTYVWPRDQTITAQAWLSAGAYHEAKNALAWLDDAQIKTDTWVEAEGPVVHDDDNVINRKGTWWQNYKVDGTKNWTMLQVDQVGGPIYVHWLCWQEIDGGSTSSAILDDHYQMSKLAAEFLLGYDNTYGMVDKHNDPWEEDWGYSTEGCAAAIAGLRCMAELADAKGETSFADQCRNTADTWASNFSDYCHYDTADYGTTMVSVSGAEWDATRGDIPDAAAFMAHWPWNVVSGTSVEVSDTLDSIDSTWNATNTPCIDRYPGDDYTPTDADEDGGWPLCEAYTDVARWQEGRNPNAVSDYVYDHAEQWRTAGGFLPERVDGDGNVRWNSHLNWSQAMYVLLTEADVRGAPFGYAPSS